FGDINYARVQAARRYISHCDEIFILSWIGRVIDDKNVIDILREHVQNPTRGKVSVPNASIICTYAANINRGDKQRLRSSLNRHELSRAEEELRAIEQGHGGLVNYQRLKEANINHLRLFVKERNRQVRQRLTQSLRNKCAGTNINIFFTDSGHYHEPTNLQEVEISGIPTLRQFCYRIRADALYVSANNYLTNSLPALVHSLELWVESGTNPATQSLRNQVNTEALVQITNRAKDDWQDFLSEQTEDLISRPFRVHRGDITASGVEACVSWNRMQHQSYRAWCHHNGSWKTPVVGARCWNSELISRMTEVMEDGWEDLDDATINSFAAWGDSIAGSMNEIEQQIRGNIPTLLSGVVLIAEQDIDATSFLLPLIRARKREAKAAFVDVCDKYMTEFRRIKMAATGGHKLSFIVEQMLPAYHECAGDSGNGVWERSKICLYDYISPGTIYSGVHRKINSQLDQLTANTAEALVEILDGIREEIDGDFESVEVADESLSEKDPALFEELARVLPWARGFVDKLTGEVDAGL
ncbi:hypothetical protein FQN49_007451, partial [Arthroderma sp. PD_2]